MDRFITTTMVASAAHMRACQAASYRVGELTVALEYDEEALVEARGRLARAKAERSDWAVFDSSVAVADDEVQACRRRVQHTADLLRLAREALVRTCELHPDEALRRERLRTA
jgi:hypothetical protein